MRFRQTVDMIADPAASSTSTDAAAPGKGHVVVLDGLRGVAAVMVVPSSHSF